MVAGVFRRGLALQNISAIKWRSIVRCVSFRSSIAASSSRLHVNKLSQRLRHTRNGDGAIVLDIENGKMFSTNGTGALLFQLLSSGLDDKTIVTEFAQRFEVTHEVAAADLTRFRELLGRHSLLNAPCLEAE
jgi:hypothetical protein